MLATNAPASSLVGHVLGRPLPEILPAVTGFGNEDDALLIMPHVCGAPLRARRDDGGEVRVSLVGKPERVGDSRLVFSVRDVTEFDAVHTELEAKRAELDTTRAELEAERRVMRSFAHELRSVLASVQGALDAVHESIDVTRSNLAEVQRLKSDVALGSMLLGEASRVVDSRLSMYKLFKGGYETRHNTQTVEAEALFRERITVVAAVYKGSRVSISADLGGLPGHTYFRVDTFVFRHIVDNLLSNAIKYTPNGGSVQLSFIAVRPNGFIEFAVVDQGTGVRDEIASRLFDAECATDDARGTGLGTYSCAVFAKAVGGAVWLQSTVVATPETPVGGSDFRFLLPGTIVNFPIRQQASPAPKPEAQLKVPHFSSVFIVEDSALVRRGLVGKLRDILCEPRIQEHETVESMLPIVATLAALDVRAQLAVLVIVDESLASKGGVLTGSELITALRQAGFKGCLISASGDDAVASDHLKQGADVVWGKPPPPAAKAAEMLRDAYDTALRRFTDLTEAKEIIFDDICASPY